MLKGNIFDLKSTPGIVFRLCNGTVIQRTNPFRLVDVRKIVIVKNQSSLKPVLTDKLALPSKRTKTDTGVIDTT